jgi:hypothetical protein
LRKSLGVRLDAGCADMIVDVKLPWSEKNPETCSNQPTNHKCRKQTNCKAMSTDRDKKTITTCNMIAIMNKLSDYCKHEFSNPISMDNHSLIKICYQQYIPLLMKCIINCKKIPCTLFEQHQKEK